MEAIAIVGVIGIPASIVGALMTKLASQAVRHLGYFFGVEDKLQRLGLILSMINTLLRHAEMIVPDPGLELWLWELKNVACDVEDLLDYFSLGNQSNYNIGKKFDKITKRLADIAEARRDLGAAYKPSELQLQNRDWRATSSMPTERYVFVRDADRNKLIRFLSEHNASVVGAPAGAPLGGDGSVAPTGGVQLGLGGGTTLTLALAGASLGGGNGGTTLAGASSGTTLADAELGADSDAAPAGAPLGGGNNGTTFAVAGTTLANAQLGADSDAAPAGAPLGGGNNGTTLADAPLGADSDAAPAGASLGGGNNGTTLANAQLGADSDAAPAGAPLGGGNNGTTLADAPLRADSDAAPAGASLGGGNGGTTLAGASSGNTLANGQLGADSNAAPAVAPLVGDGSVAPAGSFSVLPIVAMGGLGKTTLVRFVYNHPSLDGFFNPKIWVHVSNDFNVRRITEEVLAAAVSDQGPCCSRITSLGKLQSDLRGQLRDKKFLLVLDDVWSENRQEWENLCAPLNFAKKGSKILITTRSRKVADIMGTVDPLLLDPLPYNDCWDLFKACAFVNNNCDEHPRLEKIGQKIVERLNGVPLAAKTIGGLLYSNTDEEAWATILNSQLWKLYEDNIAPVLKLSYQHMPAHLKVCLQFCSLFPKGSSVDKHRLVLLWMAQGFIQPRGNKRIEDIAGEYFDELVCRYFFQKVGDNSFSMHDLMHDLALSVSSYECVIIDDNTLIPPQKASSDRPVIIIDDNSKILPRKVLHASLHLNSSFEFKKLYKHKSLRRLRTLLFLKKNHVYNFDSVPKQLFENMKYMRALDLSHSDIKELPDSIRSLKLLKYLNLSYTRIKRLPEAVGELCNLQTMLLIDCDLDPLPACMNRLIKLRNFEGRAGLLSKFVGIGRLKSLQELEKFEVSTENGRRVGELKELTGLRGGLHISKLENVTSGEEAIEASLINKQYLRIVELEWGADRSENETDKQVLESLKPHPNLKSLKIICNDGSDFPSWLTNEYLSNLEDVTLVKCQRWTALPPLQQLTSVKYLEIKAMKGVKQLLPEFWGDTGSSVLAELKISGMTEFESLGQDKIPSLLQKLDINDCPKLRVLPLLPSTLKELKLSEVGLSALPRLWGRDGDSLSTSPSSSLSSVSISSCPELRSLQQGLFHYRHNGLKTLEISNCQKLASLPTQGLSQLTSLTSLTIEDCPKVTYLAALPPTLKELKISEVGLSALPRLWGCDGASSSSSSSSTSSPSSSLSSVSISSCPELTSLKQGLFQYRHSGLKTMEISKCEKLESLPTQGFSQLTSLTSLTIKNCPKLTALSALPHTLEVLTISEMKLSALPMLQECESASSSSSSLSCVSISSCPELASLQEGLFQHHHSALNNLEISNCENLVSLPTEIFSQPTSLTSLTIENCPKLTVLPALPPSLKELKLSEVELSALQILWGSDGASSSSSPPSSFSSALKTLEISDCKELESLPTEAFSRLISLVSLTIQNCPKLTVLPALPPTLEVLKISGIELSALPMLQGCDSASSSSSSLSSVSISSCPELISLQEGLFQYRHSALKTLEISNCKNLESLPTNGFSQLTSLASLTMENCPKLTSLPEDRGLPASLKTLKVLSCTNFFARKESLLNQLRNLTSLSILSISTNPNLKSLSEEVLKCLIALENLTITDCEKLVTLKIEALGALKALVVTNCPKLKSLAHCNKLQEFIPLRDIKLRDCAILSLPKDLTSLSCLEDLSINRCPRIPSLPKLSASVRVDTDIPPNGRR